MSDTEIAELESEMRDTNPRAADSYWHNQQKQDRYLQLIEAKEAGVPAPAGPPASAARQAEIERLMADTMSDYWRGPEADKLQAEYLNLLDGKSPGAETLPTGELAEHLGITEAQAADMQGRVDSAFEGLDTTEMDSAFEGLSGEGQGQMLLLLADPSILADTARRDRFIMSMSEECWSEVLNFESAMTPEEHGALKRALLIS